MPPAVKYLLLVNVICYALGLLLPQVTYVNGSEPWLNVICGLYYFGSPNFAPYQIFTSASSVTSPTMVALGAR